MEKSETVAELAKAMTKMQGQLTSVRKDKVNPFYHSLYADLSSVWEVCRKPLAENGLGVIQALDTGVEGTALETMLLHSSGEWIKGRVLVKPVKDDPQGLGSAVTYLRRYALCAMLGISAEEDEDGNAASGKSGQTQNKQAPARQQVNTVSTAKPLNGNVVNKAGPNAERPDGNGDKPAIKNLGDLYNAVVPRYFPSKIKMLQHLHLIESQISDPQAVYDRMVREFPEVSDAKPHS